MFSFLVLILYYTMTSRIISKSFMYGCMLWLKPWHLLLAHTRINHACCVPGNVQYRAEFLPETEGKIALYCSISYTFPLKEMGVFDQCQSWVVALALALG